MQHTTTDLTALVRARHGIVTMRELLADGMGSNTIRNLVLHRNLIVVHRGVYRWATTPDTFEARCVAACVAAADVVVTGPAAARLWGFRHVSRVDVPILLAPHSRSGLAGAVELRRSSVLDPCDVVQREDSIRVASPPRAWFDCARDLDDERFEALTEWVLDRHATVPTLWATMRRLAARGRVGSSRVRRVLSQRQAWQKPADSRLELKVLRALERRGIGPMVRQHRVVLRDGSCVHLDGAVPDVRWGVEVDHVTWHGGRLDAQYDKQRDRQLRLVDWQVERVTDQDVRHDFAGTIDALVRLHDHRRRTLVA